jgi:hypothetical protein
MLQKSATHLASRGIAALAAISSILSLVPTGAIGAEYSGENDRLILEAAASGEHDLSDGSTHFGPSVGLEVEPIEDWLEVELGASRFSKAGATVWGLDMAFKKPWRLSPTLEVMPGIGPTWEHNSGSGHADTWGAQAVLDLFFWHSRRVGWFVEPAYGVAFDTGHGKSFGITAGLFVAIP